jgi:hypothetical protein
MLIIANANHQRVVSPRQIRLLRARHAWRVWGVGFRVLGLELIV